MTNLVNIFESTLKDKKYFYSIPIKPGTDGSIIVNEFISGKNGFTKEFFADRFYINTNPQSERVLIPIEFITKLDHDTTKKDDGKKKRTTTPPPGNLDTVKYEFMDLFSNQFPSLRKALDLAKVSNPEAEQKLQDALDAYSESDGDKIISEPLNETLMAVIKKAGIEVDVNSAYFTSDHLVDWFISDFNNFDESFEDDGGLIETVEKLFEEMNKECPPPNFLK